MDTYNSLWAVAAVSATDVWAAGKHLARDGWSVRQETLFQHWDGSQWSVVPSPNAGARDDNIIESITAIPGSERVVAVGFHQYQTSRALVEVWDGSKWRIAPLPQPPDRSESLSGVAALSEDDVWVVGSTADRFGAFHGFSAHWNGDGWREVPTPEPGGGRYNPWLNDVSAVSGNDVWSVGANYNANGALLTLTEHWDGARWTIVPSPSPGGPLHGAVSSLDAIAAVSTDDVWSVGSFHAEGFDPIHALIEHYCP